MALKPPPMAVVVYYSASSNNPNDSKSISVATFDNQGNLPATPLSVAIDFAGLDLGGCYRWKPNSSTVALTVGVYENSVYIYTSLALLRVGPGESPIIIKNRIVGCVSWSPDGESIAYGKERDQSGIFFTNYISGSVTRLTDTYGYDPVWSSDGKKIAFITENGISLIDVDTKEERQIFSGDVEQLLWGR